MTSVSKFSPKLFCLALVLALGACNAPDHLSQGPSAKPAAAAANPERRRASYMVGQDLAKQIAPLGDEVDIDLVVDALRAAHAGTAPLLLPADQTDAVRRDFTRHLREKQDVAHAAQAQKNLHDSEAFLAENGRRNGVTTTASGLQYETLRGGDGPKPVAADTVDIDYIGTLRDGRKIEDTYVIGHSAQFALNRVFPGMAEALQLMPVGAKYRFWVPPKLAYGELGKAGEIEPNVVLTFEIELLAIAGKTPRPPGED